MLIADALRALYKKITTQDATSDSIAGIVNEMAANWTSGGGSGVTIDNTLTQAGQAADAKAVGDALAGKAATTHTHTASQITDLPAAPGAATTSQAGLVKQGAAVTDAAAAPTQEEFNALLTSLRNAGIIASS